MNEGFSISYENGKSKEGENKQQTSSFLSVENQIKQNYINNQNKPGSKELAVKQVNENKSLREGLESQVQKETRERLDKETMISEAKTMLYEKLGINGNLSKNNWGENFGKGIVDTLILDNYDLAIQVWETNGKVILESLKQLASWEGLKKVAESIGESIWNLLSGNAYERGKSVAELGLITTGVGAGAYVGKKGFKLGMKEIAKFKKPAERFVENPKVKGLRMIDKALEDLAKYGVNRTDAMLLFASTDKYLFENINGALRGTKELTQGQIAFLERFDQALSKMPDLEGKHIIRGDSHYSWITHDKVEIDGRRATNLEIAELIKAGKVEGFKQGDKNILDAYTYVANETNDIFLGTNFPDKDTLIIVRGSNGGIKDISSLSMYKHFGEKLPGSGNTNVEGIIHRGTEVEFINSRVFQNATFNNGTYNREILVVRVKNK